MQSEMLLLSVVVPNYNFGTFLEDLLCQLSTLRNRSMVEVIVVDGASTDQSLDIAARYLQPQDILISEPDEGQADAINKGLKRASGEWFIFQNSDDLFVIEVLDRFLDQAAKLGEADMIGFNQGIEHFEEGKWKQILGFKHTVPIRWQQLWLNIYYTNQSTFYNTRKAQSIGFDKSYRFTMDYDFVVRFVKTIKPKVVIIHEVIGVQRMHDQTKTSTMQDVCLKEAHRVRREQFDFLDKGFGLLQGAAYHTNKRLNKSNRA